MRTLYADWKSVARTGVAQLRMEAAKYPDDPRLTALVSELSVQDPDFRRWWAGHHVATLSVGTKVFHHPVAGELSLDWDTLSASTDPDQQLVVRTAEPGTSTTTGCASSPRGPRTGTSHPLRRSRGSQDRRQGRIP